MQKVVGSIPIGSTKSFFLIILYQLLGLISNQ